MPRPATSVTPPENTAPLDKPTRRALQRSKTSIRALAELYGVNPKTVAKWKARPSASDRPTGRPQGRRSALSARDERAIIAFQRAHGLSLDACLAALKPQYPALTRSTLHRCLQRARERAPKPLAPVPMPPPAPVDAAAVRQSARRRQILLIAGRSFLRYGYDRTSMSAIAAEIGGSKTTLWKLFASKEELFEAFLAAPVHGLNQDLTGALHPGAPLKPALESFVHTLITFLYLPDELELYRLILGANARFKQFSASLFKAGFDSAQVALSAFFKAKIAAGEMRPCDPDEAAYFLQTLCNGGRYHRALLCFETVDHAAQAEQTEWVLETFFALYGPASER